MHLGQLIDSLDFNDDGIGHNHVQAKCLIHLDAFILGLEKNLAGNSNISEPQFVRKTLFIKRFKQPRPQCFMNSYYRSDYLSSEGVDRG